MTNMVSSLESIRDDLKAKIAIKIAELPEAQALSRIEAAIEEINAVMAMVGGLGIVAAVAAPIVEAAPAVEAIVEETAPVIEAAPIVEEVAAVEAVVVEEIAVVEAAPIVKAPAPVAVKSLIDEDALAADIFADEPLVASKAA